MPTEQDIRNKIIKELFLEGVEREVQDKVIVEVSEALLERARIALLGVLPKERFAQIIQDTATSDEEKAKQISALMEAVPDAEKVVAQAVQEGLQAYKKEFMRLAQDITEV